MINYALNMRPEEAYKREQIWYNLIIASKFRAFRHICLFAVFLLFVFIAPPEYKQEVDMYIRLIFSAYFLGIIYLNLYVFVPRQLIKGKFFFYFAEVLLTGVLTFILICLADKIVNPYRIVPKVIPDHIDMTIFIALFEFLIIFTILIAASSAVKIFQHSIKNASYFSRIQKLNFENELNFLKNQINPHFLFNTLNNVHVLIATEPIRAADLLVNLSDLLRYQIYDCGHDFVFLSSDIKFIENFLALESARRENFIYSIERTGDPADIMLPPLLFIPFVENAIKHNHNDGSSFVNITINTKNNILTFSCINSKQILAGHSKSNNSGIGHSNIKRRLSMLYPEKHQLTIEDKVSTYKINLEIVL